jgi:proteasome lid subunit RPN8/RPN11
MKTSQAIVEQTLVALQRSGQAGKEGIVLWLGNRFGADAGEVKAAYVPMHQAEKDRFWIPYEGMEALMARLRQDRLALLAQVHSHPGQAFHSEADDRWAIVRYVGALSIVVPTFARQTSPQTFTRDSAFFQLAENDRWLEVEPKYPIFEVTP